MVKEIPLTLGLFSFVDDEDFDELNKYNWCANESATTKGLFYALRNGGNKTHIFMHRQIMKLHKGEIVDHINHNGLDNRKCNLRICEHSQNLMNHKLYKSNTSGLHNVYWSEHNHKWRAYIQKNKKKIMLGDFNSKEEAGKSYDKKAKEIYGDFAVLNFD
jgi:hypothetical protein